MIKVLQKTFDALEYVARQEGRPVLPAEIEDRLRLSHATSVRILKDLCGLGYLEQTGARKGYVAGPMAFEIGQGRRYMNDFVLFADPLLEACARRLGESVLFCILRNDWRFILMQYNFNPDFSLLNHPARMCDLYQTVSGRVLLAYASAQTLKAVIDRYGVPPSHIWEEASGGVPAVHAALEKIRRDGFAEQAVSACGNFHILAYPVFCDGVFLGALAANWEPSAGEEFSALCRKELRELARTLSAGKSRKILLG